MINLSEFFNGVQLVNALAIIAFVIFFVMVRKELHKKGSGSIAEW